MKTKAKLQLSLFFLFGTTTFGADFLPQKIVTGKNHTCVLSTNGGIECWGGNGSFQLGTRDFMPRGDVPGSMGSKLLKVDLGTGSEKSIDLCAGDSFTCAVTSLGQVKCWGFNGRGVLGQGTESSNEGRMGDQLPFSNLGKNFFAKKISCGYSQVCVQSKDNKLKCWGHDVPLGLGDQRSRGGAVTDMGEFLPPLAGLVDLESYSIGGYHGCAMLKQGVRCWGIGINGQLGLESIANRGMTPETTPDKSPDVSLGLFGDDRITSISSGSSHTCAVINNTKGPRIKCWGENSFAALGTGDAIDHGSAPNTMGTALPSVNLGAIDVFNVYAHENFTCALFRGGRVKCWGYNANGELGLGDVKNRGKSPEELGPNLDDVDLGLPVKALSIGAASSHSCAILINNEIKCWGRGQDGQLGYESTTNVGSNLGQMGEQLPYVKFRPSPL